MLLEFWRNFCHHHSRDWSHAATAASSLTILVLTNRLLSRFFFFFLSWDSTTYRLVCDLPFDFRILGDSSLFGLPIFVFFVFQTWENFFLKIIFETSFQNTVFTWFVFGFFFKQVFKKRKPKIVFGSYFENKFWLVWRRQHIDI